jgi:dTDP-4-amino-4,6-dideoxygalactose transaminase
MPHALIEPSPSVVPYCYPFLLSQPISKAQFYENGIFLMTLWEDVLNRHTEGYHFEKMLSHNLLPLPIDHRLDQQDLQRIIDAVIRLTNTHAVG